MKLKFVTLLIVGLIVLWIASALAGVGDGTGPVGDGDPDRIHWVCEMVDTDGDGSADSTLCCPPGYVGGGNCCTLEP